MTNDLWKVPYPSEDELDQQVKQIVRQAFPEKRSFWQQVKDVKTQLGWTYLVPNRGEWGAAALIVTLLFLFLTTWMPYEPKAMEELYYFVFFVSPLPFVLLVLYALYEKREKQVMELEMTMKITIFQILALRMVSFSGIALFASITASAILAVNFDMPFLRILLISLAGLFSFTAIFLAGLAKGHVWRMSWGVAIGWGAANFLWMSVLPESYMTFLFNLPLVIYTGLLGIACATSYYAFKQTFLRKQEELAYVNTSKSW